MFFDPFRLVGINLGPRGAFHLHDLQRLGKRLDVFGHAKNEFVISRIDGAAEQLPTFGISSGNDEVLTAHQVPLKTRRD